jgi:hypothetical protein
MEQRESHASEIEPRISFTSLCCDYLPDLDRSQKLDGSLPVVLRMIFIWESFEDNRRIRALRQVSGIAEKAIYCVAGLWIFIGMRGR